MIYEVGNKVRINLNAGEQIHSIQEVWDFQGVEARVTRRKILAYGKVGQQRGTYYELQGVKSKMGVPFGFLEDQLVLVND